MARPYLIPAILAAGMALAALPTLAQEAPAAPPPAKGAELRLDFGGGRKVAINCGDTAIAACIEASQGLVDKVASTPVVEDAKPGAHMGKRDWMKKHFMKEGRRGDHGKGGPGEGGPGKGPKDGGPMDGGPMGEGAPAGNEAPPPILPGDDAAPAN